MLAFIEINISIRCSWFHPRLLNIKAQITRSWRGTYSWLGGSDTKSSHCKTVLTSKKYSVFQVAQQGVVSCFFFMTRAKKVFVVNKSLIHSSACCRITQRGTQSVSCSERTHNVRQCLFHTFTSGHRSDFLRWNSSALIQTFISVWSPF